MKPDDVLRHGPMVRSREGYTERAGRIHDHVTESNIVVLLERFGEDIGGVEFCVNLGQLELPGLHALPYPMISDIDMLGTAVRNRVPRQGNGALVVLENREGLSPLEFTFAQITVRRDAKVPVVEIFLVEAGKPYGLLARL